MSELQARSMNEFRKRGYLVASVERRKRFPSRGKPACKACGSHPMIDIAVDLWNIFDLIAVRPHMSGESDGGHIIFVQTTSSTNHADRRNKIIASAEAKLCLLSGASIVIQSWRKKDNRWVALDEWIALNQFCVGLPDTIAEYYEDEARKKLLERKSKLPDLPPGTTMFSQKITDDSIPF